MTLALFAGVPVADHAAALSGYGRLSGSAPAFFPNDHEAVRELAEHRYGTSAGAGSSRSSSARTVGRTVRGGGADCGHTAPLPGFAMRCTCTRSSGVRSGASASAPSTCPDGRRSRPRSRRVRYSTLTPAWVVARANTLAEWRDRTPFAGLQVPDNLLRRDVERELLPMAEAFGMSVAAWAPLAAGRLCGAHSRRVDPTALTARERAAVEAVRAVADELGATAAQVAIAWTRHRSAAVLPLVGVSSVAQLTENLGALDLALPVESVRRLEDAVGFERGFPGDFIAEREPDPFVFGDHATAVDGRG